MKIAVVTDSTSDITGELAEAHGIHVIPAVLVVDGESFEDGEGLDRTTFYNQLPGMKTPPTTAAPSTGKFQEKFHRLLESGVDKILSIHVASQLSGIVNAARLAAESFDGRVQVMDSGQLSLGLGFQAIAAAQMARNGGSFQDVLDAVSQVRRRLRVVAMVDTMEYLRRSGRVSFLRARFGAALRVRLFIELKDGQITLLDRLRTRKKGVERLNAMIAALGNYESFAMLHTNSVEEAREVAEAHAGMVAQPSLLVNVTTVIGTHVGPNALGFAGVLKSG
jgi:DegV family protein with EDD domain